jgi:hypothetical protein
MPSGPFECDCIKLSRSSNSDRATVSGQFTGIIESGLGAINTYIVKIHK